jgi:alanine racemase
MQTTQGWIENQFLDIYRSCCDIGRSGIFSQDTLPLAETSSLTPSTRAIIDLGAFRHNLAAVRAYVGQSKIMAVVKANAYGHGVVRIAADAASHGAEFLGVARVHEGVELRLAGLSPRVLVFEAVRADQIPTSIDHNLELTAVSVEQAQIMSEAGERAKRSVRVHVKVDTGMGRLGFPYQVAADGVERIARMQGVQLEGLYSHFATSDEEDAAYARQQMARFGEVIEELRRRRIEVPLRHMANSGAIIAFPESHLDMVRPGIMLYGYAPRDEMPQRFPLRPVLSLVSSVAFVKEVGPNESISYGRKYTTVSRTRIATVPVGYADGYSRLLTGKSEAIIRGKRYPIVGTICMDHVMVDLRDGSDVREGDDVTLIGSDGGESITSWDISAKLGTIPYEVTSLITARVPRIYRPLA